MIRFITYTAFAFLCVMAFYQIQNNDGVGAVSFPTSLDTLTNPSATDSTATVSHAGQHSDANDAIEALEAKVGADGSAVTTSHDYKLSGVTGSDKAASLTGTETFTNKTFTTPAMTGLLATSSSFFATTSIDLGSDATGDVFYRNSAGNLARLAFGSNGQFLTASSTGNPEWITSNPADPTIETSTNATTSLTVDGATLTIITYRGNTASDCSGGCTVTMKLDATTLDTISVDTSNSSDFDTVVMMDADTLAATTSAVLSISGATMDSDLWIIQKW